ncbi:MAG: alpha-amylase family glycosyl hydrolase [Thermodesulfobacteriota bacterium]|nr:alpha-amylase family glycosyl hydrolase [Thermodesulfobacteriota bacterium]
MCANVASVNHIDFTPQGAVFSSPRDWRDHVMYFLLVDRFDNNAENIPAYDPDSAFYGRDPEQGGVFQGGNLKGVLDRLDYIKDLGCSAIWLSPIFKNRVEKNDSYHGYGIQDFLTVDPRFGTMEDIRALVKEAHKRGMYVVQDIIFNHTGDNWSYPGGYEYQYWKGAPGPFEFGFWRENNSDPGFQEDDAVWPLELQSAECYKRRGSIVDWNDNEQALNGDFCTLKELNLKHRDVLDTLIKSYKYWIAQTDVDGFRIDTVKHMEDDSVAVFCNALREYAKRIGKDNFFMFGEIVASDEVLQRYIGRNSRIEGTNERFASLDACLDFPLYFVLEEVIKGFINPLVLRQRYDAFHTVYSDHGQAGRYFVTFVDNHDQMSRPYRRFMHNNPNEAQAVLAIGYLLTSQGVPCIYYGTEQGFDGGGDNDRYVRECMFGGQWGAFNTKGLHFFNQSNPIYQGIKRITEVRASEPALRYGRQYFREISGNGLDFGYPIDGNCTLAYSRILDTEEILVVMNLSSQERNDCVTTDNKLTPPGSRVKELTGTGAAFNVEQYGQRAYVRLSLSAYQIMILKKE